MPVRILDLDGSVASQSALRAAVDAEVVDLREWGPSVRMGCSFGRYRRFREALPSRPPSPALQFVGSGDFHHVSLALVARIQEPVNLVVIDKHPDWMRAMPVMHCGTWLWHASRLPQVAKIFHVGGDLDFDNEWRRFAPWSALRSGKIVAIPAVRQFRSGGWKSLPHRTLRPGSGVPASAARVDELLTPYAAELASRPLYISLDKDAMAADDAITNWDQGELNLSEVLSLLDGFAARAGHRIAGMDVVGDWSPVEMRGPLRRFLDWSEHPPLAVDAGEAARLNGETNVRLLEWVKRSIPKAMGFPLLSPVGAGDRSPVGSLAAWLDK